LGEKKFRMKNIKPLYIPLEKMPRSITPLCHLSTRIPSKSLLAAFDLQLQLP
jgi:hypothetical protein